uniref:Polynucleotide 5'-hydroxyl-kinase NOL9 n=1 Tax=Cyanoderma ruficeps TaxID=181631 RepID=A0A8C3P0D9_9PASS
RWRRAAPRTGRGGAGRGAAPGGGGGSAVMPARRSRPRRALARAPARASRTEAAWREFASSFTRTGMVPPAEPGLVAVEAAEACRTLRAPHRLTARSVLQALTFTGKCRLRCLYGAVRLLGFAVASHHPGLPVFSPATHCALSLEALPGARPPAADLRQLQRRPPLSAPRPWPHTHPALSSNFTPEDAVLASVGIVKCSPDNGLQVSESTCLALEELIQACCDEGIPVVLVCGPKNTGKSTFNRYLINLLLNHLPVVEYMECDIGQAEFTPPGCVSLSSVTEPVLGPPYTHQQMPHKVVYYGQTSCEQDTERYLDVVKYVFSCCKKEVPLVINTMGWVKGDGLLLLIDLIRLLSPSHIVQMDLCDWEAMPPLTPDHVHFSAGLHTKGKQQSKCKQLGLGDLESWKYPEGEDMSAPQHKLLYVNPEFPRAGAAVHSGILHDMSILGYLGHLQSPDIGAVLPLHCLVPYQVPFNAVALRVIHTDVAPSNIMYAVNASWVGLCCIPEEVRCQTDGPVLLTQTPICDCLGFGIVRGVDVEKKLYHILTPVPPENLRLVNCLLLGNIAIPECVLVGQQGIEGEIPYVTSDYNYSIVGSGKLRKNKQHLLKRKECDYA